MIDVTFEISISAIVSGAIGGYLSFLFSKKLNRRTHQMNLRYDKYDDFVITINRLRDYIDIVTQETKMEFLNYKRNGESRENRHMELFNEILEVASKLAVQVRDYGKLFNISEFDYSKVCEVHGAALNIAFKMRFIKQNPKAFDKEKEYIEEEYRKMEKLWAELRLELIEKSKCAYSVMQKDFK